MYIAIVFVLYIWYDVCTKDMNRSLALLMGGAIKIASVIPTYIHTYLPTSKTRFSMASKCPRGGAPPGKLSVNLNMVLTCR